MTTPATADDLRAMLAQIVNRSAPAGTDSCDQPMVKVRAALIEEARKLLNSGPNGEAV